MASKFGKFVAFATLAGAAAAGVYYYLNQTSASDAEGRTAGGGEASTGPVSDFFKEKKDAFVNSREYVTLNKTVDDAKDVLKRTVAEATEAIKEKAAEARDGVGVVKDENVDAKDFEFDEFKEDVKEGVKEAAEDLADLAEEAKDTVQEALES